MSCWMEHMLVLGQNLQGQLGGARRGRGPTAPRAGGLEGRGRDGLPTDTPLTPAGVMTYVASPLDRS